MNDKLIAMGVEDDFVLLDETEKTRRQEEGIANHCVKHPNVMKYSELSVLIIDDDVIAGEYTKRNVRRLGMQCRMADNAEHAIQIMEDAGMAGKPFDLCLINWHMHETDGAAMAKKIRERFDKNSMLIMCVCREKNPCEQERNLSHIDYVLERPITQAKLYQIMAEVKSELEKRH